MGNINDFRRGQTVRSIEGGHGNWLAADFPGWGAENYADFLNPARPGVWGEIVSVESHGSNPWTRYSIRWETGERASGQLEGKDFEWFEMASEDEWATAERTGYDRQGF